MLASPMNATSTPIVSVFKFTANNSLPHRPLSFARPGQSNKPNTTITSKRKRPRPLADLDDSTSDSKKKRRLRLVLITSRLSRPFSTPATHIVDRGSSKIAIWAKKKSGLGQQVLRKTAIMNFVRCRIREKEVWLRKDSGVSIGEDERAEVRRRAGLGAETGVLTDKEVERWQGPNSLVVDTAWPATIDRCVERTVQPSPFGLSNYDALDEEDEVNFGYSDEEDGNTGSKNGSLSVTRAEKKCKREGEVYYTDWTCSNNVEETAEEEEGEDEYGDPFSLSVLSKGLVKAKGPPSPPEGEAVEFAREREREVLMLGFNGFEDYL